MKNREIAAVFAQMADLMEILDEDPFRVNSYRKAARSLEELTEAVEDLAAAGRLTEISGIGKSMAQKITQYLAKGEVTAHQELLKRVPHGLPGLLAVPGMGPKTLAKLWKQAGVTALEELKSALADPARMEAIKGMGPRKAQQLLESLAFLESGAQRVRLDQAEALAAPLIDAVKEDRSAKRVLAAGSLRRGKETIGDIDLLCEASPSAAARIIAGFTAATGVTRVLAKGGTKGSVLLDGDIQADLRVIGKKSFGAALMYFTGSKDHNVRLRELAAKKGLKLNEYGLFRNDEAIAGPDEEGVYKALGMPFIPPELREDRGEVAAAVEGRLPKLLESSDIRGDLHVHTTASDGMNTIEEMIAACRSRGYAYFAICDHSKSQVQARGLDEKRLTRHVAEIRRAGKKFDDILVLTGVEVDIFKDGSLDFEPDVLEGLDFVTASPHSALSQGASDATPRLIKAIESGCVHCIGHPSGRLINARPGMELDIEAIASAAARHNVALEVNADPARLDLRDTHVRVAIAARAKIVVNTDAHSVAGLDLMRYGVRNARRGWATAADVINAYPPDKLLKWLKDRR
jgi:DNA polymerase (family 10)